MTKRKSSRKAVLALASSLMLIAILAVPFVASASSANRVFYMPDGGSFVPTGSFGGDIAEGGGNGINKLTINAGSVGYYVYFTIHNNNQSGTSGTTYFETRKGPGNNDLSGNVALSATAGSFTDGVNSTNLTFNGTADAPLYVRVYVPPCGSGGTFRIQAHPGGSAHQGNGPGVVAYINCNGYTPPTPTPTATPTPAQVCYDYYGNPIPC